MRNRTLPRDQIEGIQSCRINAWTAFCFWNFKRCRCSRSHKKKEIVDSRLVSCAMDRSQEELASSHRKSSLILLTQLLRAVKHLFHDLIAGAR